MDSWKNYRKDGMRNFYRKHITVQKACEKMQVDSRKKEKRRFTKSTTNNCINQHERENKMG